MRNMMKYLSKHQKKEGKNNMKRTLILMTVLNVVMMTAGASVALAQQAERSFIVAPEPTSTFSYWPASWVLPASHAAKRNNILYESRINRPTGRFICFRSTNFAREWSSLYMPLQCAPPLCHCEERQRRSNPYSRSLTQLVGLREGRQPQRLAMTNLFISSLKHSGAARLDDSGTVCSPRSKGEDLISLLARRATFLCRDALQ